MVKCGGSKRGGKRSTPLVMGPNVTGEWGYRCKHGDCQHWQRCKVKWGVSTGEGFACSRC